MTKHERCVAYVKQRAERYFADAHAPGHGVEHAAHVAHSAAEIARREGAAAWLCEAAGWLHDVGRVREHAHNPAHKSHHELSFDALNEWFQKDKKLRSFFTAREREELIYAVRMHWDDTAANYASAVILRDADKLDLLGARGIERHFELRAQLDDVQRCIWFLVNVLRGKRLVTKTARQIAEKEKLYDPFYEWIAAHLPRRKKVLCALSGGVDSAVAAYILKSAGFDVTGVYMKNWSDARGIKGQCSSEDDRKDALRAAARLDIPFLTFNFEKEYRASVVSYMFAEYKRGRTPNPDVLCNKHIKFPLLLKKARALGFDYVATGHYARILHAEGAHTCALAQAADRTKDQSYFLHQLRARDLPRILFPLSMIGKDETRVIARQAHLPVADKADSMGICFIGEVNIKQFLQQKIKSKHGPIIDTKGRALGTHDGLYWHTEGQRRGLNIGGGAPYFVVRKDMRTNTLVVAKGEDNPALFSHRIYLEDIHWIDSKARRSWKGSARVRHRQPLFDARVRPVTVREKKYAPKGTRYVMLCKEKQRASAPGQFAVLYNGDVCAGGAVIAGTYPVRYTK